MPIYEFRCEECGKEIEVFGQTAEATQPPTLCTCGNASSYSRRYSTFAAHGGHAHSGAEHECCGGMGAMEGSGGGCGGGGGCRCGHHG